jgi:hypothetical protein
MLIPTEARCRAVGILAACVVFLWPALSGAQMGAPSASRSSLVVTRGEGAEDCPDASSLAEQVHRLAGAVAITAGPLAAESSATWIQVAIVHTFGGYRGEITAGGLRHGTRSLEDLGPGCGSLADAITITIAIFLDPYSGWPAPRPTPTASPVNNAPQRRAPESRWSPRVTVDFGAGAAFSVLEHSEPLVTGRLGWRATDRWSFAFGGAFVFPDSVEATGGTVDLGLSYAYLMGCGRALGDAKGAHLDWCAAPLLGSLRGTGQGYQTHYTERAWWAALAAGPEVLFPFTPKLAWLLGGLGALPLVRQGFDVQTAGHRSTPFREHSVAAVVTLGVRGEL